MAKTMTRSILLLVLVVVVVVAFSNANETCGGAKNLFWSDRLKTCLVCTPCKEPPLIECSSNRDAVCVDSIDKANGGDNDDDFRLFSEWRKKKRVKSDSSIDEIGKLTYEDDEGVKKKKSSLHADLRAIEREILKEDVPVTSSSSSVVDKRNAIVVGKQHFFSVDHFPGNRRYVDNGDEDEDDAGGVFGNVVEQVEAPGKSPTQSADDDFGILHDLIYHIK